MRKILILGIVNLSLLMASCSSDDNGTSNPKTDGKINENPSTSDGGMLTEEDTGIAGDLSHIANEAGLFPDSGSNPNEAGTTSEAGKSPDVGAVQANCKMLYECESQCAGTLDTACINLCLADACKTAISIMNSLQACQKKSCSDCKLKGMGSTECQTCSSSDCSSDWTACQNNQC